MKRYDSICPACQVRFDGGHSQVWVDIRMCADCVAKPRKLDRAKPPPSGIGIHSWGEENPLRRASARRGQAKNGRALKKRGATH